MTSIRKRTGMKKNLSCIPSAYYIVCLRQQNTNSVYLKMGEIKGLGMIPFIYGTDKFYNP